MPSPIKRVLAPARVRVEQLVERLEYLIHATKNDMVGEMRELQAESTSVHRSLTDQYALVSGQIQLMDDRLESLQAGLEGMMAHRGLAAELRRNPVRLEDIDLRTARYLNNAYAADGPLRDAGFFVNGALTVLWHPGEARLERVNERIVEIPFVHRSLADLPLGSRVVDIGGGESLVGLELASLGYETTVVEPRGYPFHHPNLTVEAVSAEAFAPAEPFDAVVMLSMIEHVGVGSYDLAVDPDLDLAVMRSVWAVTRPGGRLVLTTPFGRAGENELERTYDLDRLRRLLAGWAVDHAELVVRTDALTWERDERPLGPVDDDESRVVMLVAHRAAEVDASVTGLP